MDFSLPERAAIQIDKLQRLGEVSLQTEKSAHFVVFAPARNFLEKFDAMRPEQRTERRRHRVS